MSARDPRNDPAPGDIVEHPRAGQFRKVRQVEAERVYYIDIDAAGATRPGSDSLSTWCSDVAEARVVYVEAGDTAQTDGSDATTPSPAEES